MPPLSPSPLSMPVIFPRGGGGGCGHGRDRRGRGRGSGGGRRSSDSSPISTGHECAMGTKKEAHTIRLRLKGDIVNYDWERCHHRSLSLLSSLSLSSLSLSELESLSQLLSSVISSGGSMDRRWRWCRQKQHRRHCWRRRRGRGVPSSPMIACGGAGATETVSKARAGWGC